MPPLFVNPHAAMKRPLNLNELGYRFLAAIGLFGIVIPAALGLLSLVLARLNISTLDLATLVRLSALIAVAIGAVLLLLVMVERIQDNLFDKVYRRNRRNKIRLADGAYECQYCGNRQVGKNDTHCAVCGKRLFN